MNLLSDELLVYCTLSHFQICVSKLLLYLLLNNTDIIHPGKQEIEIVHHLAPTGSILIRAVWHLLQQDLRLRRKA